MKQPSNEDSRLEDDDIASLFAAQSVSVPNDLKLAVYEQAQYQLNVDAEKAADIAAADDHATHNSDLASDISSAERTQNLSFHSRSRWFAVAATVLVAAVVTPMLLNTPDSSLNSSGIANYDLDSATSVSTTEPAVVAEPAAMTEPAATAEPVAATEPAARAESADELLLNLKPRSQQHP